MRNRRHNQGAQNGSKGFSLIDAVFAVLILSAASLGMMTVMSSVLIASWQGENNSVSTSLAQEQLEKIMNDKANQGYTAISNALYTTPQTITIDGLNFVRTTNIYEVSLSDLVTAQSGSGLKRVDVTVAAPAGYSQSVQLSSLLGNYQ